MVDTGCLMFCSCKKHPPFSVCSWMHIFLLEFTFILFHFLCFNTDFFFFLIKHASTPLLLQRCNDNMYTYNTYWSSLATPMIYLGVWTKNVMITVFFFLLLFIYSVYFFIFGKYINYVFTIYSNTKNIIKYNSKKHL